MSTLPAKHAKYHPMTRCARLSAPPFAIAQGKSVHCVRRHNQSGSTRITTCASFHNTVQFTQCPLARAFSVSLSDARGVWALHCLQLVVLRSALISPQLHSASPSLSTMTNLSLTQGASPCDPACAVIELPKKNLKFLITPCPEEGRVDQYTQLLAGAGCVALVRLANASYSTAPLSAAGIAVHDLFIMDGQTPSPAITACWNMLVAQQLAKAGGAPVAVAVHCQAGLGRAPLMVAVALVEAGMAPEDAVAAVRARRCHAFNTRQLKFLFAYRRQARHGCTIC